MLFSPAALPNINSVGSRRVFLDYGSKDPLSAGVKKFCEEAAKAGVTVTVSAHENSGHIYRSVSAIRERDEAVMKFLYGL